MLITETKVYTRPNSSTPFFNEIRNSIAVGISDQIETLVSNGSASRAVYTVSSENNLIQTQVQTFSSLDAYSQIDTLKSLKLEHEFKKYYNGEEFNSTTIPVGTKQYEQTGIGAPFTCTITYTYNPSTISAAYPLFDSFINVLENADRLTALTNTGSQIVAVFQYSNSEDFTETHWNDYQYVEKLDDAGITRTIAYAMV